MNKINMKDFVYLAGPMEDCTKEAMTDWRIAVRDKLDFYNIEVLDPYT